MAQDKSESQEETEYSVLRRSAVGSRWSLTAHGVSLRFGRYLYVSVFALNRWQSYMNLFQALYNKFIWIMENLLL
jgi:hypothetical protein